MATSDGASMAAELKAEANAEFGKENYLKAAALYAKAIKADPENAVLYSNRSAALLKLLKVGKALEDADTCIKLRPEWEKGYFRKGAALEASDKYDEALEVYEVAQKMVPDSKDIAQKIRSVKVMINRKSEGLDPKQKIDANGDKAGSKFKFGAQKNEDTGSSEAAAEKAPPPPEEDLGSAEVAKFTEEMLGEVAATIRAEGTTFSPMIHFLPGPNADSHEEAEQHVRGLGAFDTPETLRGFTDYLRQQGSKLDALAAFAVMPKPAIAIPQTWTKKGWKWGNEDGVFVQLDSRANSKELRKCWWIPVGSDRQIGSSASIDPDVFGPLPLLVRV